MDYTFFSKNIYENPDVPINKFLINLQREDDCGYFCKECFDLDSNNSYKELSTGFFRNWDKHSIEFLILIKEYFKHIIEKFNNNDSNIAFTKSNTGLTIILKNCVIRIIKYEKYNKLKKLYDALSQERTDVNIKYDNFERNPYLENMNPDARVPYCKPYWSDTEPNNFGYPISLTQLGYLTQNPL